MRAPNPPPCSHSSARRSHGAAPAGSPPPPARRLHPVPAPSATPTAQSSGQSPLPLQRQQPMITAHHRLPPARPLPPTLPRDSAPELPARRPNRQPPPNGTSQPSAPNPPPHSAAARSCPLALPRVRGIPGPPPALTTSPSRHRTQQSTTPTAGLHRESHRSEE